MSRPYMLRVELFDADLTEEERPYIDMSIGQPGDPEPQLAWISNWLRDKLGVPARQYVTGPLIDESSLQS